MAQTYWNDASAPIRNNQSIKASNARTLTLDKTTLKNILDSAPLEENVNVRSSQTLITIPMPDGTSESFRFVESPVMAPELQERFPGIRAYLGQGVDNPQNILRFDLTHKGFHAMVLKPEETVYIDPISLDSDDFYLSYTKADFYATTDKVFDELPPVMPDEIDGQRYDNAIDKDRPTKKAPT